MSSLRLTEIFFSLQGETRTVGLPTVFIRLTGCPLRCQYCDTAYAFQGGQKWEIAEILREVAQYQPLYVTVTGGEPLAQPACIELLQGLCDAGYQVSLETSGALSVEHVDVRVMKVVDIKTPASLEESKNHWPNLAFLTANDQLKFVICNQEDYDWAKNILHKYQLNTLCEVLFSPSANEMSPRLLADQIIADRLPVRLQIQLHKYLWGDVAGK